MVAVGSGLTVMEMEVCGVLQPAAVVSMTESVPPLFPNMSVMELAEGGPTMAAPAGILQLYTEPALFVTL